MTFIKQMKERPRQMLMIFLVGLLLLVISLPVEEKKEEIDSEQCLSEIKEDAYAKQLENKLEQVLTEMEGVGQVRVMLTFQEKLWRKTRTILFMSVRRQVVRCLILCRKYLQDLQGFL